MKKRKLPIGGVQTFGKLRAKYDVYVDKTKHIYEMATSYEAVFLARPRRFGKSLLCSTIESLFRGEKELFEGLYIYETDWDWKKHPVIHLDLSARNYTDNGVAALLKSLNGQLDAVCREYEIVAERSDFIEERFTEVIAALFEKHGSVVVIIDEYDFPLISTISQQEINEQLREKLKGFYGVLKRSDRYLRFVFVTGITKFAQISMFSGFNQPKDITMLAEYCDICGITYEELENYFKHETDAFAPRYGGKIKYLEKLRANYDGYFFTKDKVAVFNTYGLLNHFDSSGDFMPFWSMSGHPSLLQKYLETKEVDILDVESAEMSAGAFADYKDNTITLVPLLYQAGYLTIADYNEKTDMYTLRYPNIEIRKTLAAFLASNYSKAKGISGDSVSVRLVQSLLDGKLPTATCNP